MRAELTREVVAVVEANAHRDVGYATIGLLQQSACMPDSQLNQILDRRAIHCSFERSYEVASRHPRYLDQFVDREWICVVAFDVRNGFGDS